MRADIAFDVSKGQQGVSQPTVDSLVQMNKIIKKAKENPKFTLTFQSNLIDYVGKDFCMFVAADASHANIEDPNLGKVKSQAGYVLGVAGKTLLQGQAAHVHVLEWPSALIKQVVRATLSAEAYGVTEGAEGLHWLRCLVTEAHIATIPIRKIEDSADMPPAIWLTDSESLVTMIIRDCGRPAAKRLRIVAAGLKQMLSEAGTQLRWIDTLVMLADALTKSGVDVTILMQALVENEWDPSSTQAAIDRKLKIRAERAARKALAKAKDEKLTTSSRTLQSTNHDPTYQTTESTYVPTYPADANNEAEQSYNAEERSSSRLPEDGVEASSPTTEAQDLEMRTGVNV